MMKDKTRQVDPSRDYNIAFSCNEVDLETIRSMHKKNLEYYQNFTTLKWIKFYFYILIGKIHYAQIPSDHPYWKEVVRRQNQKMLEIHLRKYEECLKDRDKIKYHYNQETSLKDIEEKITRIKCDIQNRKHPSKLVNILHDLFYHLDVKYKVGS